MPVFNIFFALLTLFEVICTCRRFPKRCQDGWASDREFIVVYLLRQRYRSIEPTPDNNELTPDNIEQTPDNVELISDNTELTSDNTELTSDNNELTSVPTCLKK